jgi:DNA replicative helicase MCM subunit Mcm2 (Cdc46/Mcm family)
MPSNPFIFYNYIIVIANCCKYDFKGDEQEQIDRLAEDNNIYSKLARSLAPEIFGHEDAKNHCYYYLLVHPIGSS